jgi:phage shock protein PspC (stress-responsive transcriptional regulator)
MVVKIKEEPYRFFLTAVFFGIGIILIRYIVFWLCYHSLGRMDQFLITMPMGNIPVSLRRYSLTLIIVTLADIALALYGFYLSIKYKEYEYKAFLLGLCWRGLVLFVMLARFSSFLDPVLIREIVLSTILGIPRLSIFILSIIFYLVLLFVSLYKSKNDIEWILPSLFGYIIVFHLFKLFGYGIN